jgi:hypothetical protein
MKTAPLTRSGWSAARSVPQRAPQETPTIAARSVRVASRTARASSANCPSVYASISAGRSAFPLPLPSNVRTRKWRARYAICSFQWREWMIDQVGSRKTVGSPLP